MADILIPIFICVVLPVAIVFLYVWKQVNADNKRSAILMEAVKRSEGDTLVRLTKQMRESKAGSKAVAPAICYLRNSLVLLAIGLALGIVATVLFIVHDPNDSMDSVTGLSVPSLICIFLGIAFLILYFVVKRREGDKSALKGTQQEMVECDMVETED